MTSTEHAILLDELDQLRLGEDAFVVTPEVREQISELVRAAAAGHQTEVHLVPEYLTTQQAADRLRVTRPTLVKMLEDGLIPFEQPNRHRRIHRADLQRFIDSLPQRRRAGLDALAETLDPAVPDEIVQTR